jgi:hypothetical protein
MRSLLKRSAPMVISRVGPLSIAKIAGLIYAVFGLIFGAMFSLLAMTGFAANAGDNNMLLAPLFGIGAVILFPICYGLLGFVSTLIMTALFNVAAGMMGGVEVDIK